MKTLLLNASYEPLRVITIQRAVVLVLTEKAEIVKASDLEYHSERQVVRLPSVIRLLRLVKIPYNARVKLSKKSLIARDGGLCGYCGKEGENIDHIVPRSKGGKHVWSNVVWSCRPCNDRKADKTLEEAKMKLLVKPYTPKDRVHLILAVGKMEQAEEAWEPYLAIA
jgi:5-methylcytosine-specific restriction endonuclease McrA